jgi:hypothetical protein
MKPRQNERKSANISNPAQGQKVKNHRVDGKVSKIRSKSKQTMLAARQSS